jgi:hypothetical protein
MAIAALGALLNAPVEYAPETPDTSPLSSAAGDDTAGSGETTRLVLENPLFYRGLPARTPPHRPGRQPAALILRAPPLTAFSKPALRNYYLRHYIPRKFFRTLVVSLLLGGRAPPSSAC